MYQYINTRMLQNGCAVLCRYDGKYQVDIYLTNGNAPVHSETFNTVSRAKAWREDSAQFYAKK